MSWTWSSERDDCRASFELSAHRLRFEGAERPRAGVPYQQLGGGAFTRTYDEVLGAPAPELSCPPELWEQIVASVRETARRQAIWQIVFDIELKEQVPALPLPELARRAVEVLDECLSLGLDEEAQWHRERIRFHSTESGYVTAYEARVFREAYEEARGAASIAGS